MTKLILVGAGGFLGSTSRYLLAGLVHRLVPFTGFPYGTLTINIIGCIGIGFLAGLMDFRQALGPETRGPSSR